MNTKLFERMEFNPTIKKSLVSEYPKLKSLFGDFDDKMMRYIILMYDVNSPLKDHYPDLAKRKEASATMSGYDLLKDDVVKMFEFKIQDGEDYVPYDEMINLVINYLKYQNNWVWSMIVSNENAFYEYVRRVMMPVEGSRDKDILQAINIKTQVMESQDQIYQRLQRYYRELSGGDSDLQDEIVKRRKISPESIAIR